jgi:hypothetical protein
LLGFGLSGTILASKRNSAVVEYDLIVHVSAPGLSPDLISTAQETLIDELNERGPIAITLISEERRGSKGPITEIGQIGIALLSAGVLKYIAQVLTEFVRRNDRIVVKVGDIEISKDNASKKDEEFIARQLSAILAKRSKTEKRR